MTHPLLPRAVLGLLWLATMLVRGEEQVSFEQFWAQREKVTLANQQRIVLGKATGLAEFLKWDGERREAFSKGLEPLIGKWVQHWRQVYELRHKEVPLAVGKNISTSAIAEIFQTAPLVQLRASLHLEWAEYVRAQLKPEELVLWEAERVLRRARADKALPGAVTKRCESAAKSLAEGWKSEIEALVIDAELTEMQKKALMDVKAVAEQTYARLYRERLEPVVADATQGDHLLLPLSKLEDLEQRASFSANVPGTAEAQKLARQPLDQVIAAILTPELKSRLEKRRKDWDERVSKAAQMAAEGNLARIRQDELRLHQSIDGIAVALKVGDERQAQWQRFLDERRKKAETEFLTAASKTLREEIVKTVEVPDRDKMLKEIELGGYYLDSNKEYEALVNARQLSWQELLKTQLTSEERARYEQRRMAMVEEGAQMWAQLCISEMDHRMDLLEEQRARLLDLILPSARRIAAHPDGPTFFLRQYGSAQSLLLLDGAGWKNVEKLLDEVQAEVLAKFQKTYVHNWNSANEELKKVLPEQEVKP
jgi:hypothetical protein